MLSCARMKPLHLLLAASFVLSSCSWLDGMFDSDDYLPEYMKEASPMDPPGTAEAREALRQKLVKEGQFVNGAEIDVRDGKAFLFRRNPDYSEDPGGRMVQAEKAKIMSCEGTYYFVETSNGKRGYMRESDFVDPISMLTVTGDFLPDNQGILPDTLPGEGGIFPGSSLDLGDNKTLTSNETGRIVKVVDKKTEQSDAFEEAKRRIEEAQNARPTPSAVSDDFEYEPLPAPKRSAQ